MALRGILDERDRLFAKCTGAQLPVVMEQLRRAYPNKRFRSVVDASYYGEKKGDHTGICVGTPPKKIRRAKK